MVKGGRVFCPRIADGLEGRAPSERLGAVHPLRLTVGPGVVGLGQAVLDAVLGAGATSP